MGEVGEQGVAVWGGGEGEGAEGLINDTFDWTRRDQFQDQLQWRIKNGTCEEPEQFKQFGVHYRAKGRGFQEACLPSVNDGEKTLLRRPNDSSN